MKIFNSNQQFSYNLRKQKLNPLTLYIEMFDF